MTHAGNAFVPYQSNGLGQPVGNPVSQGDGTFNVVFPLPGLSPELAGKYDSYRLYYKEVRWWCALLVLRTGEGVYYRNVVY